MKLSSLKRSLVLAAMTAGLISTPAFVFGDDRIETISVARSGLVNDLFAHQWVTTSESGDISGSVVGLIPNDKTSAGGLNVYLVKDSQIVQKAKTDTEGKFLLQDVVPGSFSLIVRGPEAVGAFSLNILSRENGAHLASDVEVRVVKPAGKVSEIVRSQTIPRFAARVEPSTDLSRDPLAPNRTFAASQQVMSDKMGQLSGKIGALDTNDVSDMTVFILRDGVEVAKAPVAATGEYMVPSLQPGVYGFVAAGESGVVATSFELVPYKSEQVNAKGERLIGIFRPCRWLNAERVPYQDVAIVEVVEEFPEEIISEPLPTEVAVGPQPFPGYGMGYGGGGGFSGGGGGGGFGGGGGWAGLAGIAGLATVAGIVASNDNDGSNANSPN